MFDAMSILILSVCINFLLAAVKIFAGFLGRSHALIADGIESLTDVVSSLIVWKALKVSSQPADEKHPYGHGKAESIAGAIVAGALLLAAILIAVQSIQEILVPQHLPEPFTLFVLLGVIVVKEVMYRFVQKEGRRLGSRAMLSDAWHHRSDAITSGAAFIGISIAVIGGEGFESMDDWAALVACVVIVFNGVRLLRPALDEIMDASVSKELEDEVRKIAAEVEGVRMIEKCRIRKSGLGLLMDIHVVVSGDLSVREGHEIAHLVDTQLKMSDLAVHDVVIHIEPD
jgi:cation diffusion facilitator family transporter